MIYPKDNKFVVSKNAHSLALQNAMTTVPTAGSTGTIAAVQSNKDFMAVSALRGLGDTTGGYDYNTLLQSQTLSFGAQYGTYIVGALALGAVAWGLMKSKRSRKQ
jgi:hypothetical protein